MTHSHAPWLMHMHHDSFTCNMTHSHAPWLIHMHHDSFTCSMTHAHAPWLIHMYQNSDEARIVTASMFQYVTLLIHIHMYNDSFTFICTMTHPHVPWLRRGADRDSVHVPICNITHSHSYVPWLIHIHMYHDSFTCTMTQTRRGSWQRPCSNM